MEPQPSKLSRKYKIWKNKKKKENEYVEICNANQALKQIQDSKDDEDEIEVIIPPPKPAPPIIDLFDGEESGENVSASPSSSCSRSPIKTKMCKVEIQDLKTHPWWGPKIRWSLLSGDQKSMSVWKF